MPDNTSLWTGALISLVSIGVTAKIAELRDWLKERRTKRRVANALSAEILAQANAVATCASLVNFVEFELPDHDLNTTMLLSFLPPEPVVYRSLASQLASLDMVTVSAIIAFYGSTEWAKRLSTQHSSEATIPQGFAPILGAQWRAATRNAIAALQHAGRDYPTTNETDIENLKVLITDLADIVEKKWPRTEQNSATGKLKIR